MKKSIIFLSLFFTFFLPLNANMQLDTSKIKDYTITKEFYSSNSGKFMVIRKYKYNQKSYFLLTNLNTLRTSIISLDKKLKLKKETKSILQNSNYDVLRKKALKNNFPLSNAGLTNSLNKNSDEVYLTVDMCPSSKKGYEKEFFEKFLNIKNSIKKVPISIAITYKWVKNHKNEFLKLINNPKLDITWINHSKTHYFDAKEELSKNFMLNENNDLKDEIIEVEKMLILNSQNPSILFRFPGLISNDKLVKELIKTYSLLPLGTNNWLVKSNKAITNGDVVLVHGNLNEKEGIEKFINEFKSLEKLKPIYNFLLIKSKE